MSDDSTATANAAPDLFAIESLSKHFGSVQALQDVSVTFKAGQVHALLGANGSGKSTLVKIMSGVQAPSSGVLRWRGKARSDMGSPSEATALGIHVVHQEAPLIDKLSVLEAVATFQGYGVSGLRPIPWRRLRKQVRELLDQMDIRVGLNELCVNIGPSDRAGLALAIAMAGSDNDGHPPEARLLILDEVTASIPETETEAHLDRVRKIADAGTGVIMVTHRLAELRIADDITVLREGRVVYREDGGERRSVADLVAEMVAFSGRAVNSADGATARPIERLWEDLDPSVAKERAATPEGAFALRLDDVTGRDLHGLSVDVRGGEVVGFVGLPEGGIRELPRILAGSMKRKSGVIVVGSHTMSKRSTPREFINAGLMSAPSDRLREGGVASLSMIENVTLPSMSRYWHRPAKRRRVVNAVIEAFDVRPQIPSTLFGSLSGGNQQKVLLGKWLLMRPIALVLDDPTYGVDPAAREHIFSAMIDAARLGVAVLFFSTEPELLSRVCRRVEVVREGIIEKELSGDELTPEALMEWSYA